MKNSQPFAVARLPDLGFGGPIGAQVAYFLSTFTHPDEFIPSACGQLQPPTLLTDRAAPGA